MNGTTRAKLEGFVRALEAERERLITDAGIADQLKAIDYALSAYRSSLKTNLVDPLKAKETPSFSPPREKRK